MRIMAKPLTAVPAVLVFWGPNSHAVSDPARSFIMPVALRPTYPAWSFVTVSYGKW